jgi:hypothetical protein
MANLNPVCRSCLKKVQSHSKTIKCHLCSAHTHILCLKQYSAQDIEYATNIINHWTCPTCLKDIFPFYEIEESANLYQLLPFNDYPLLPNLDDLILNPFDLGEEVDDQDDLDPDSNYYINQTHKPSRYMHINAVNKLLTPNTEQNPFSILHLNIRSLKRNFDDLTTLLSMIEHKFTVVALTESWLKKHNVDLFPLEGYNSEHIIRDTKIGGGSSTSSRLEL